MEELKKLHNCINQATAANDKKKCFDQLIKFVNGLNIKKYYIPYKFLKAYLVPCFNNLADSAKDQYTKEMFGEKRIKDIAEFKKTGETPPKNVRPMQETLEKYFSDILKKENNIEQNFYCICEVMTKNVSGVSSFDRNMVTKKTIFSSVAQTLNQFLNNIGDNNPLNKNNISEVKSFVGKYMELDRRQFQAKDLDGKYLFRAIICYSALLNEIGIILKTSKVQELYGNIEKLS